jgi:hypothetical protein
MLVMSADDSLPDDVETLKRLLRVGEADLARARAEVASARAQRSDDQALIAHLKLQIEKLNRDRYGPRSERTAWLLDQLELQLEELEATATEDEPLPKWPRSRLRRWRRSRASGRRENPSPSICRASG